MRTLWQDLRFAARALARSPGFAAVIIVTLALGIGASTAIFSVIQSVLLRPLPYENPEQLVMVWRINLGERRGQGWASYPDFRDWRSQNHVFTSMAAYHSGADFTLTGRGERRAWIR